MLHLFWVGSTNYTWNDTKLNHFFDTGCAVIMNAQFFSLLRLNFKRWHCAAQEI